MNDAAIREQQNRLAVQVFRRPDFEPASAVLTRLKLTADDITAMRGGTWTPPNPTLDAVRAALAPMLQAAQAAQTAVQAYIDNPTPQAADLHEAMQAVAQVTVALAETTIVDDPLSNPIYSA